MKLRYAFDGDDPVMNRRDLQRLLRRSLPRFLAYAAVRAATRSLPQVGHLLPVVVGFVVPDAADLQVFERATKILANGFDPSAYDGLRNTSVTTVEKSSGKDPAPSAGKLAELLARERVFVLAHSRDHLPQGFDAVADLVVDVARPRPELIQAAARACLGMTLTEEEAGTVAGFPLSLIGTALRQGRPPAKAVAALKLIGSKPEEQARRAEEGPSLEELKGFGEAAEWGRELATDLADWRAGRIAWSDVDRGVLLSGPPGCGKTMFASALAVTCDVSLVTGSLARWQAKGHLGDLLREMRGAFAEAARSAPSVLFVDELDSFGNRESFDRTSNNAQYCREVVNGFLECLDGAGGREGVVVVGATNFPDAIDAAIRRPGRLDRHIAIPLPDLQAREGILQFHLGNDPGAAACRGVAARTEGWTGARLEQLARDARRRARRERRQVTATDLAACLPELLALSPELRRRAAVHEAGHAVVGFVLGRELVEVRIADSIEAGSGTQSGGGTKFREGGLGVRTRQYLLDGIAVVLAGLAAEEVILGARSSGGGGQAGSDLHEATLAALAIEAAYGLGQGLTYLSGASETELLATLHMNVMLQGRVEKLIAGEFERAKGLVHEHADSVRGLAEGLLSKGRIKRAEAERWRSELRVPPQRI